MARGLTRNPGETGERFGGHGGARGRIGPAGFVALLAGRAAGAVRAARRVCGGGGRRGSVLVLILGAIAMLAVVTVAYVTVGQSDRRTGAMVVQRDRVGDTIEAIVTYISRDVIGRDVLSTYVDGVDTQLPNVVNPGDPGPVLVREAHDAPSIDPELLSTNFGAGTLAPDVRFDPAGSYNTAWQGGGRDPRFPSDPWLSSPEPTWLLGEFDSNAPVPGDVYLYKRDWSVISNIAPSGNPVNLFNLRNNFDAPPGFSANPFPPANATGTSMSDRLSLFDDGGQPTLTTWYGHGIANSDAVVPFYWTAHQRNAYRPAKEARGNAYHPGNPEYLHYQWADADGDGIIDSRWFELVDISDKRNPVSILPRDDRFRWFVSTRIIDLSGRANVNTALNYLEAPSREQPAGITPAEIDLRRLLRLSDAYTMWPGVNGYAELQSPGAYSVYSNNQVALDAGDLGFYGLAYTLQTGYVPYQGVDFANPPPEFDLNPWPLGAQERVDWYRRLGGQASSGMFSVAGAGNQNLLTTGGMFGLADQLELLAFNGINDPSDQSALEQSVGGREDRNVSPLRDNRDLRAERDGHDNAENGGNGNGLADDDAMVLEAFDARRLLTAYSASRLLRSSILLPFGGSLPDYRQKLDYTDANTAGEMKVDARAALEKATETDATKRDARMLFAAYADALLPHSWRADAWNRAPGGPGEPLRTMFYGNDPVLALWCAAHMTANAIDMYDRDGTTAATDKGEVSTFTLAVSGVQNDLSVIDNNPDLYPFWTGRPQTNPQPGTAPDPRPRTLDLDSALGLRITNTPPQNAYPSRLARQGDLAAGPGAPEAMNIYGIEAQPFLTQVVSLMLYTDAPASTNQPDEWQNAPPTGPFNEITIDGSIDQGNPDFICQVLAFQITNPFDQEVGLSRSDSSSSTGGDPAGLGEYYLEYGGNYFKLVEVNDAGGYIDDITLKRRDSQGTQRDNTRIVYVLNDTLAAIQQRFVDSSLDGELSVGGTITVSPTAVRDLIERQLSMTFQTNEVEPILIARMNGDTGQILTGWQHLTPSTVTGGGTPPDLKSVKLWRKIETPGVTLTNDRNDDLLADRLRDPTSGSRPMLARGLPELDRTVSGVFAVTQDPTAGGPPADPDNGTSGYSICLWSSIKRSDDPGTNVGGSQQIPQGALPAYCLEVHPGAVALANPPLKNWTHPLSPTSGPTSLALCDFSDPPCGAADAAYLGGEYLFGPQSAPNDGLQQRLADPAAPKRIPKQSDPSMSKWPEEKAGETPTSHNGINSYAEIYPEIHLNNAEFERTRGGRTWLTLRTADMLLPLCVGATEVPDPVAVATPGQGWLTLGEALAFALGYADVDPTMVPHFAFLEGLGLDTTQRPKTDRGNLALNRFVPFEDVNRDREFTPGGNPPDEPRSPGVPLGGTVLDVFHTMDPDLSWLERGVQGLVNLSTAPYRVLKVLPLACPTWASTNGSEWWGLSGQPAGVNITAPPRPGNNAGSDHAAAIEAYRDRTKVLAMDHRFILFQDTAMNTVDDASLWDGRFATTGDSANLAQREPLREAPGLASLGELLVATRHPGVSVQTRLPNEHRLDNLGREGAPANSGRPGVNSTLYRANGAATGPTTPTTVINEIPDDYAEKLAVAGTIANTATVRSDTFACWLLVHGYQRSDCEGLNNNNTGQQRADPLSPTIARRYLLVIDRSNVTRLGDKPRILIMQELPF